MDRINSETIYRALTGRASAEEERQVAGWWEDCPEECSRIVKDLHALIDLSELSSMDGPRKSHGGLKKFFVRMSWAAAVAVLVLGGAYVSHEMTYDSVSDRLVSIEAPEGERIELTLPDSTVVYLNSGAKLTYPVIFKKDSRTVSLSGEAMFDVTPDAERPFSVSTFASEICVLGTEFGVMADEEDGCFETVLVHGRVRVTNLIDPAQNDVVLYPNDKISMKDGRLCVEKLVDAQDELCWTRGLIGIGNVSFAELMDRFEKSFVVKIVIDREAMPDMTGVGGKIRMSEGVGHALRILQHAVDFRFRIDDKTNTVTIY